MSTMKPATTEDAQLILKLYELRREDEMRKARNWYFFEFNPQSVDDVRAVWFNPQHPHNAHFRMVTTYWDMAASFVVHGTLNGDLFLESGNEMISIWAVIGDYIEELRKLSGLTTYLGNIDKVIQAHPAAQERLAWMKKMIERRRESAKPENP
ncbi:MAG: hypothetical protein AB1757_17685 [Acidobacteriota bacterium]